MFLFCTLNCPKVKVPLSLTLCSVRVTGVFYHTLLTLSSTRDDFALPETFENILVSTSGNVGRTLLAPVFDARDLPSTLQENSLAPKVGSSKIEKL